MFNSIFINNSRFSDSLRTTLDSTNVFLIRFVSFCRPLISPRRTRLVGVRDRCHVTTVADAYQPRAQWRYWEATKRKEFSFSNVLSSLTVDTWQRPRTPTNRVRSGDIERRQKETNFRFRTSFSSRLFPNIRWRDCRDIDDWLGLLALTLRCYTCIDETVGKFCYRSYIRKCVQINHRTWLTLTLTKSDKVKWRVWRFRLKFHLKLYISRYFFFFFFCSFNFM